MSMGRNIKKISLSNRDSIRFFHKKNINKYKFNPYRDEVLSEYLLEENSVKDFLDRLEREERVVYVDFIAR